MQYRAVNSCLMMLPQLDGCDVITVEGLARPDGSLHPVQQALVDADATQCGFCTPGFVMAMFAFAQGGEAGSDDEHPRRARRQPLPLHRLPADRRSLPHDRGTARQRDLPQKSFPAMPACSEYRHGDQVCFLPRTLDELLNAACRGIRTRLIFAGGTDLGLLLSKEREQFPAVILTGGVRELKTIETDGRAGDRRRRSPIREGLPALDQHFPSFAALVRRIGSRQIRNLGTFAGNLATASPIGDTLPCLIALGAQVTLRSKRGDAHAERRRLHHRLPQDRAQGGRNHRVDPHSVPAGRRAFHGLQIVEAFRPGHLDRHCRIPADACGTARSQDLRAAYGGMAAMPMRALRARNRAHREGMERAIARRAPTICSRRISSR